MRAALADPRVVGGAFRLRFEPRSPALRLIEWGDAPARGPAAAALRRPGAVRAPRASSKSWAECRRRRSWRISIWCGVCKRRGRIACLPLAVTTSARRYRAGGVLRSMLRNGLAAAGLAAGAAARADRGLVSPVNVDGRARARPRRLAPPGRLRAAQPRLLRGMDRDARSPTSPASSPCRCSSAGR